MALHSWTLEHLLTVVSSCLPCTGVLGPAAVLHLAGGGRNKGSNWRADIWGHPVALLQWASEPNPRQQQGEVLPVALLCRAVLLGRVIAAAMLFMA